MKLVKRNVTLWLAAFLVVLLGSAVQASAADAGISGAYRMEEAPEMEYEKVYGTQVKTPGDSLYYKFKTLQPEGVYVIAVESVWNRLTYNYTNLEIRICDNYKRTIQSGTISGEPSVGRDKKIFMGFSMGELEPDRDYFLNLSNKCKNPSMEADANISVYFIPFQAPENVSLSYDGEGHPVISWSNENAYNTYSSLTSYDFFKVQCSTSPTFSPDDTRTITQDPSVTSYTDYSPKSAKMYYRIVGAQIFYYPQNKTWKTTMEKNSAVVSTEEVKKGATYTVNEMKYKVTDERVDGNGSVTLTGTTKNKSNKNFKSLKIGSTVTIYGRKYKITAIGNKAFRNYKKLTSISIGNNVETIGKESFSGCTGVKSVSIGKSVKTIMQKAFFNCKKLSKIKISSKVLSSIGSGAIKNIRKKAVIKIPSSKMSLYRGLLGSRTGYKKSMKIKK